MSERRDGCCSRICKWVDNRYRGVMVGAMFLELVLLVIIVIQGFLMLP
jgi:hypothetical protein